MNFTDFQEAILIVAGSGIANIAMFALAGVILLSVLVVVLGFVQRLLSRFE
jgi:hypothetical protein